MGKLIFLDIDGVLNCQKAYVDGFCKYKDSYGQDFYPPSKDLLNNLINKTNADIVISSTWRLSGLDTMQSMWVDRGMSGNIVGITPSFMGINKSYTLPRGCEIEYYLNNNIGLCHINWSKDLQDEYIKKSGYDNYIIIDDDSDMLYNQRNHFIHVLPSPRNISGFNEQYYKEALDKLSKTIIDLNYQ